MFGKYFEIFSIRSFSHENFLANEKCSIMNGCNDHCRWDRSRKDDRCTWWRNTTNYSLGDWPEWTMILRRRENLPEYQRYVETFVKKLMEGLWTLERGERQMNDSKIVPMENIRDSGATVVVRDSILLNVVVGERYSWIIGADWT